MADATITKRLIISGLTPAITVDDVNRRLGSFGSVKAIDGFGLQDGLGQPRKFGYVTLETTQSRLGKCMNILSGPVWKGKKLRLDEAKPDYKERIANDDANQEPPKKRRRFDDAQPGWKASPLGRITRPLKIRPIRPLTHLRDQMTRSKLHLKNMLDRKGLDKKKKNVKVADARMKRRTIDKMKWRSTHLKANGKSVDQVEAIGDSGDEGTCSSTHIGDETPLPVEPLQLAVFQGQSESSPATHFDLEREKTQTLDLLSSLFDSSRNEDDWIGTEGVGSDVEMGKLEKEVFSPTGNEPAFEEVPRTPDKLHSDSRAVPLHVAKKGPSKVRLAVIDLPTTKVTSVEENTTTKLKDLFAPREEAAFSLLDHLDLDTALDEDLSFLEQPMSTDLVAAHEPSQNAQILPMPHMPHAHPAPRIVLNPKQALFFPLPPADSKESNKARQRDVFDLIRENGWYWRDPAVRFWNTETEGEIKKKWEASRGELTKTWKQRWREAGKVRRRKKLVDRDEQM